MRANLDRLIASTGLRVVQGLLLAATLIPGAAGSTTAALAAPIAAPVPADDPIIHDHRDPDARIQVVIRKIIVHDDMDWGDGDIRLAVQVRTNGEACDLGYENPCGRPLVSAGTPEYSASDGDVLTLNRYVPKTGDDFSDPQISWELGIPIRFGNWYGLRVTGIEVDAGADDGMGQLNVNILNENGQVRYGTFTERGIGACELLPPPGANFCPPATESPAAFSVEYEIRPATLPDLRPVGINVLPIPGSNAKLFCVAIQNAGPANAGSFNLTVQVDGVTAPEGSINAGGMASGQAGDLCVQMTLAPGQHHLTAIVDGGKLVPEVSETNNRFEQPYIAPRIGGADSPVGQPPVGNIEVTPEVTVVPATAPTPNGPTTRATSTPTPKPETTKPETTKPAASPTPKPAKTTTPAR